MRRQVFPKENEDRVKETKKELKSQLRKALKRIKQLENELENLKKPVRPRKVEKVKTEIENLDQWRADFVKRFKDGKKEDE